MGGNFQQHQGVEFNNPDGTPVLAIGPGRVVYAGRAEQGALTVAIRHDTTVAGPDGRLGIYSVYYHNSELDVAVGQQVSAGQRIARVGNTGRATNDHLHLEVHAAPGGDVALVVDSLQRYPAYTTNPELWIEPLPGTGLVAGQVLDAAGKPVPQARIYGLVKPEPAETPFSFAETYGDRAHPHPLYGEHFAVSDVPPGSYVLGTEIGGKKVFRRVTVEEGLLTWVVFRP
jgi:murein DD-endopeptidase MepM/ murein hydrolase activator NlpD